MLHHASLLRLIVVLASSRDEEDDSFVDVLRIQQHEQRHIVFFEASDRLVDIGHVVDIGKHLVAVFFRAIILSDWHRPIVELQLRLAHIITEEAALLS